MAKEPTARKGKAKWGLALGTSFILGVVALCITLVVMLLARASTDTGIRLWVLNHAPDQVVIVNPYDGIIEKQFQVADGLKDLAFSRDFRKAYITNMVDVTNKLTVIDTNTYLKEESIVVDGVPQGIGVFPDNKKLAVIAASKTDFMAGGFDVLDLYEQSKADPTRKKNLYRERDLELTHKIAIGDDGDRIYCVDAKKDTLNVFSFNKKEKIAELTLNGAPEEFLYPAAGDYYYISVLQHKAIYQFSKDTDELQTALIYAMPNLENPYKDGRLRHMAIDSKGEYLVGTNYELATVAIWKLGDPANMVDHEDVPVDTRNAKTYRFEIPHQLPMTRFKLTGGYNPNIQYIPGGQHVAIDPLDDYLAVVDDDGAVYFYEFKKLKLLEDLATPLPVGGKPVTELTSDVTDIMDMKFSSPMVRM